MITPEQAGHIASLIRIIRPAWDQLVIMNTLRSLARFDLADLTHAAIRTASDETMRTPAAIAWTDSEHWRPTVKWTETPAEREQRKTQQVAEREQGYRNRATLPDPTPYVTRIRAEIRPCKAPDLRPEAPPQDTGVAHSDAQGTPGTPSGSSPEKPADRHTAPNLRPTA